MKRLWLLAFLLVIFPALADSDKIGFTNIPDLNLTTGNNDNLIDLDNYYNGTDLTYKFKAGSKGLNYTEVSVDSKNNVDIVANIPGQYSVIFIADNGTDDRESNDVKLDVKGEAIVKKELDFFPVGNSLTMMVGEKKTFAVSGDNVSAEWYLNSLKLPQTTGTFVYDAALAGNNTLQVIVGDKSNTWNILVEEVEIVEPVQIPVSKSVCGNAKRESGENCENCPEDVSCAAGSSCRNAVCVKEEGIGSVVIWIIALGVVISGLVAGVIFARKKGYLDNLSFDFVENIFGRFRKKNTESFTVGEPKEEVKEIEEDLSKLKNYIMNGLKSGYKKEDLIRAALGQGWKQEQINKIFDIRDELKPLTRYIEDNLIKGYKKEDLIRAALGQGWKQEDIDEVFDKIGK